MKFSEILQVTRPEYVFLRIKPNNAVRNQGTDKVARAIAALYTSIRNNIRIEERKYIRLFGRDFGIGTQYKYTFPGKVAYYIYMERGRVEFYFICPRQYLSYLREKMSDVWGAVTIDEVSELPLFSRKADYYQLTYVKEDALSLAVDRRNNDLLSSNLNAVEMLEDGDKLGIFYNFIPTNQISWKHHYRATIDKVHRRLPVERNKFGAAYAFKFVIAAGNAIFREIAETLGGKKVAAGAVTTLDSLADRLQGNRGFGENTVKKASSTILETQIVVMSESPDKSRQRNAVRSLAQSFDTISDDNRLDYKPFRKTFKLTDRDIHAGKNKIGDQEAQSFLALPGRELLDKYHFVDRIETQETEVPEDLMQGVMCIGENVYRGNVQRAYLTDDKEYKYLTTVLIGPTRAGKSTLIANLGRDAILNGECMVIFDYIKNCELSNEIAQLLPQGKVLTIECGDFKKLQGLGYNEIGKSVEPLEQYDNAKRSATQILTLVDSISTNDSPLTPKMKRYLESAAVVVATSGGSIRDVFRVLQDHEERRSFINKIPKTQNEFLSEIVSNLNELDEWNKKQTSVIGTKDTLISGIIDRMNELKRNTCLELMLKKGMSGNIDLVEEIQKNQLICIRMPEWAYPTDGERDVICTYWMTKLWLALQIRGHQIPDRSRATKVNIVIDELYQVRTTEKLLSEKLSRLAKFGAKPIISAHYMNQISGIRSELRSANASYMLIAGCDKKNFDELKSELQPYTEDDLLKLPRYHSLNLIKNKDGYARFITKLPKPI